MFKKLKDYILLKLGISELRHHQRTVEKRLNDRIDFLGAYINISQTEDIVLDKVVMENVNKQLESSFSVKNIEGIVHKNDVMFAFHLYKHRHDTHEAVLSYFRVGIETAKNLQEISSNNNIAAKNILDFGSGYGRVSRFIPWFFNGCELEVSEVKAQSLDFQKRHFGFEGISHTQDSNSFPSKTYDLILALSVFTHLPKTTFGQWLNKLIASLNPGGGVVFTFNNTEDPMHVSASKKQDFAYQQSSEDTMFSFLYDSINDTGDYGNTYISHSFLEGLLSKHNVTYKFLGKTLVKSQEAIIVIKK